MGEALCTYCYRDSRPFTDEHVLPDALGGKIEPVNPFKLSTVCVKCNGKAGRHIDGPFARSWLVMHDRTRVERMSVTGRMPLHPFGRLKEIDWKGLRCDFWLGPSGDSLYHFHEPYPGDSDAIAGEPTHVPRKKLDPGFLILFIHATNPAWHPIIAKALVARFGKRARIYIGNAGRGFQDSPPFYAVPEELRPLRDQLFELNGKTHNSTASFDLDVGDRFMAKFALGFGTLRFGENFAASSDAQRLRQAMWEPDPDARAKLEIRGAGFLNTDRPKLASLVGWNLGHTVVLAPVPGSESVLLYCILYGRQEAAIEVCSSSAIWSGHVANVMGGDCWAVAPSLRRCVGPVSVIDFVDAIAGRKPDSPLAVLMRDAAAMPELPPRHLTADGELPRE